MSREPIYAVHPGAAPSGGHVGFLGLCRAYGIDPRRALNMGHPGHAAIAQYRDNVIHLYPRDGDYRLPA